MTQFLEADNAFLITAALGVAVSIIGAFLIALRSDLERGRLPAAVRKAELEELVGAKEERLRYLESEIKQRDATLSQRDQAEAEAEHWRSLIETLRAEYAGLEDLRQEIESTREEFRQAAEDLALKETERRELHADLEHSKAELKEIAERRSEAEARLDGLEARENKLSSGCQEKQREFDSLEARLSQLREEKAAMAAELERQRERLSGLHDEEDVLEGEIRRQTERREALEREIGMVSDRIAAMAEDREQAEALRQEVDSLRRRKDAHLQAIDELQDHARRLEAKNARREEELGDDASGDADDDERILEDLRKVPACLGSGNGEAFTPIWPKEQAAEEEHEALNRVKRLLDDCGLHFPRRTIDAFHTSLKTAIISPLTVLAGISGTGKSQLPRRYADAMGMHFLKIPVQPRWDSPQDLFGFYNYIEKRYKATDLARALVHLDPYNWPSESERFRDSMLLVLLDEMNLARVEYYFSEFLSRLEGRPKDADADNDNERRPAEIGIDVSRKGQGRRVYAGQNVLFVGTMNEDESTLTLSDKVLDRANVLRFPRPPILSEHLTDLTAVSRAEGYLPKVRWTKHWICSVNDMGSNHKSHAKQHVDEINQIMDELGRPFGHRMSQAMLHYVANYPSGPHGSALGDKVTKGLADQLEQRIMPKLRGVDATLHKKQFRQLADLARGKLKDKELGDAIDEAVKRSETTGMFNWRGCTRSAQ